MKNIHEEILIKALKEGQANAFEKLYEIYYEKLCQYLLSYSQDRSKVEDVVQETFITLWNKREQLQIRESAQSYLYRTAYNKMMDTFRTKSRTDSFLMDYYHTALLRAERKGDNHKKELLKKLKDCVEELPDRCREVFLESKFFEKTNQQVALDFKISLKTVEGHISKGYRLLKKCMKKQE